MGVSGEKITENLNNPDVMEDLYQSDKKLFSQTIKAMHNDDSDIIIKYWYARLFYRCSTTKQNRTRYIFTALLIVITWVPLRLSDLLDENVYLIKAIPIVSAITLSMFFLFGTLKLKNIILSIAPCLVLYAYFLLLPDNSDSQSIMNAFYFMLVLLWFCVLASHSVFKLRSLNYNSFIEKNGEIVIWSTIFIIGGIVIVLLSLALFNAIGIDASNFYVVNIITLGLVASPFVSLLVIENNRRIKLSPTVANIFLPVVLISLLVFGVASIVNDTKPYEDRDIFIIYNVMNVLVICILVFTSINGITNRFLNICFSILPVVTVILNAVTLSAVIYRINEYGITPNKITLLGTNIVMLGHLVFIIYSRFRQKVVDRNLNYLPVYFIWSLIVVFVFPFVFKNA